MKHKTLGTLGVVTATTNEQTATFKITTVLLIKNDDLTNDLIVNFNAPTSAANCICLKPGESIEDLELPVSSVYYKSSAATVAFRLIGVNMNE